MTAVSSINNWPPHTDPLPQGMCRDSKRASNNMGCSLGTSLPLSSSLVNPQNTASFNCKKSDFECNSNLLPTMFCMGFFQGQCYSGSEESCYNLTRTAADVYVRCHGQRQTHEMTRSSRFYPCKGWQATAAQPI
eukprot:1159675-Pelagomonas_calceolata.AAC.6